MTQNGRSTLAAAAVLCPGALQRGQHLLGGSHHVLHANCCGRASCYRTWLHGGLCVFSMKGLCTQQQGAYAAVLWGGTVPLAHDSSRQRLSSLMQVYAAFTISATASAPDRANLTRCVHLSPLSCCPGIVAAQACCCGEHTEDMPTPQTRTGAVVFGSRRSVKGTNGTIGLFETS